MTRCAAQKPEWSARILALVALAIGAGCPSVRRPDQPEPVADWMIPHVPSVRARPASLVRFNDPAKARYHMRMHFDDLRKVEQLLVSGKLDEGRALAYLLAHPTADAGLAGWEERSNRVSAAAREITRASNVNEALRQLARVAVECAGCHLAARSTPVFASHPPPPDRSTREAVMARHAWAAERLWQGLLGADDARWSSGLAMLAEAPLPPAMPSDGGKLGKELQAYARAQLDTRSSTSLEARGIAYGEILVRCAGCHATRAAATPQSLHPHSRTTCVVRREPRAFCTHISLESPALARAP